MEEEIGVSHIPHLYIFVSVDPIFAEVLKGWWFDFRRHRNSFQVIILRRSQKYAGHVRFGPAPGQNRLP